MKVKANLSKLAALVMVFLISSLTFVTAAEVCCEKLKGSDEYCVYTDEENCDPTYKDAAVSCSQTSFCKTGCCYSSDEGECYKNTPRAKCTSIEGTTWTDSADCGIPQCQKGCCVLGSQGFFVTEVRCKLETSKYGNVTMEWKPEITTEPECQALARSQDMGCCVSGDSCTFTIRESCAAASTVPVAGNETGEGFYKDMLCSNDLLSCGCAKQTNTGCYDDKVYWFDSCGNRENVYSSDKVKSYNNGYVLNPDEICESPATLNPECGNCDYGEGSICRSTEVAKVKPKEGNFICSTTKCESNKNGESWCRYDSSVGKAQDPVGARHYRRLCINGEEMTEACMDYREEICIQGVLGEEPTGTYQAFQARGDYLEATCRDNRWEDCTKCNDVEGSCGAECSDAPVEISCKGCSGDEKDEVERQAKQLAVQICCAKKCCENEQLRDCYFLQTERSGDKMLPLVVEAKKGGAITAIRNLGYCVPQVPPGLEFWPEGAEFPTSTTRSSPATTAAVTTGSQTGAHGSATGPGSSAEGVCSFGNQECTVSWYIGGTGRIGIGGLGTQKEYECVQNCHCTEPEWVIGGNTLCKALGDCGAYFNILGRITMDGYANTASEEIKGDKGLYFDGYKLKEKDVGDWETLAVGGDVLTIEEEDTGFIGGLWGYVKQFGVPLLTFAGTGLWSLAMGGKFLQGATGGLSIIGELPKFLKGWDEGTEALKGKSAELYGEPIKDTSFVKDGTKYVYDGSNWVSSKSVTASTELSNSLSADWSAAMQAEGGTGELMQGAMKQGSNGNWWTYNGENWVSTQDVVAPDKISEGLTEQAAESGKMQGGGIMGTVNTIMWLYTIYKLIDVFFADTKEQTYTMSCSPWVALEGGKDCTKCNDDPERPCSIYRCKSLGQNCYLVNMGTSEEECINMNPNDVNSPIIEPWEEAIPDDYTITPTTSEGNKGYKVNEKIGPYDSITLGIQTNEPAQCKFTDKSGTDFDTMVTFFGESQYLYDHQITFVIPAEFTTKDALRQTGDTYNLYIRCKDTAGNSNERDYFIRFTLEPEPDMTAPRIERTSIENGAYISSSATQTGFSIYVNEKANCKYDVIDKEYELMDIDFTCSTSAFTANSALHGLYECKTVLDLTNMTDYQWYIRCQDTAENKNRQSYKFSLNPTEPLEIISLGPTGTLYEEEVTLKAVTAEGAENGKATCAYSDEDLPFSSMILFLNTDSAIHEQPLTPGVGEFTYYVRCLDVAGNMAADSTTFVLDVDLEGPKLVYIYVTASNYLHIEMDEASTCEYGNQTFAYGDGKPMTGSGTMIHELSVTESMYHIVCQDIYSNEASFVVYP